MDISNPEKLDEHLRFINTNFGEFIPDESQKASIERRALLLLPRHPGEGDCRILAEVEEAAIPTLVTFDTDFKRDLSAHTSIPIKTPVECWENFAIPRGTQPKWTPAPGHALADQTWWRWE
jgi:hypothetical protein